MLVAWLYVLLECCERAWFHPWSFLWAPYLLSLLLTCRLARLCSFRAPWHEDSCSYEAVGCLSGENLTRNVLLMVLMHAKYSWATRSHSRIGLAVMPRALGCRLRSTQSVSVVLYSCPAISWSLFREFSEFFAPLASSPSLGQLSTPSRGVQRLHCASIDIDWPRCAPWILSHIIWSCKHVISAEWSIAAPHRCAAACYMWNVVLICCWFEKFSPRKAKTVHQTLV